MKCPTCGYEGRLERCVISKTGELPDFSFAGALDAYRCPRCHSASSTREDRDAFARVAGRAKE